ncbi:unnamed protein product [Closterium sp. NIES-64]|nr:unnamed protein product [Closterium sp. NIES-64]
MSGRKETVLDLARLVDKGVCVKLNGGRQVMGTLKGYDQLINLVLDEAVEYERGRSRGSPTSDRADTTARAHCMQRNSDPKSTVVRRAVSQPAQNEYKDELRYTPEDGKDEAELSKLLEKDGMEIHDMVKPRPMRLSDLLIVYCYHMIPFTLMPIVNTILNYYLVYQMLGWWGPLIATVVLFILAVCPPFYNRSIRRRLVFLYEALAYYMKRVRYIAPKDLIPDSAYIFAFHPHGRMFYTNTMMIQTNYEWRKNFCPKGDFFAGAAAGFYSVPVLRNLLYLLGTMPASESNIRRELRKKNHMAIVIGGLKEVCLGTTSHTDKLYLMRRKGFARIAVQEKVGVIPIYCFNENQLFKHDPVWFLQFWEKVNRHVNIGVPFMRGAWNLTLPFRRDLLVVVGKPLFPEEGESVDDFHARYVTAITQLFHKYVGLSAQPNQKLVIV